jgi:hypothetical protein
VTIEGGPRFQSRTADGGANDRSRIFGFSETGKIANAGFEMLHTEVVAPHTERGLVLHSPDPLLDQAVLFNQYLLDLSYVGKLIAKGAESSIGLPRLLEAGFLRGQ